MEGFNEKEGQLYVDDLPISEIADKYSTPAFIYSASLIRNNYNKYANALTEGDLICYAVKANSNIHILKELVKLGSGFDVVSGNELKRCIKAGSDPKKIVFSGVAKSVAVICPSLQSASIFFVFAFMPLIKRPSKTKLSLE
jgi:diaminopimelate decarboxylase